MQAGFELAAARCLYQNPFRGISGFDPYYPGILQWATIRHDLCDQRPPGLTARSDICAGRIALDNPSRLPSAFAMHAWYEAV